MSFYILQYTAQNARKINCKIKQQTIAKAAAIMINIKRSIRLLIQISSLKILFNVYKLLFCYMIEY